MPQRCCRDAWYKGKSGKRWVAHEDALDTLLYLRLTLALAAGIACGVTQSQGLYVFLGFLGLTYAIGRMWLTYHEYVQVHCSVRYSVCCTFASNLDHTQCRSRLEEETFGGSSEKPQGQPLHFEGFPQSVSLFVLTWVISFNFAQA
ncbi:hypothetical protein H632_c2925p0 [Helicosporidium sp. ATCC 50920]|nr:hypothetical protein H632_c2925p0 [Helicosporidium sp. ATCC 50920]|eukprot:KDD72765.1 hypothetical protein H632_c2925p0 [Helicosporidium sp. ATCC 50920]